MLTTKRANRWWVIVFVLVGPFLVAPWAQAAEPTGIVTISSPAEGSVLGGLVSVLGTVSLGPLDGYTVAFGAGDDPGQWIPILGPRSALVTNGRLAFWDTTTIPDGIYSLRVRAVHAGERVSYQDYLVRSLLVSNWPETRTPQATPLPTSTPTLAPTATATVAPLPTLALDDGVSPYLYVTLMDQFDPLCPDWRQSYSVWVSNVGMMTITQVVVSDTLPADCIVELYRVTKGSVVGDDGSIEWRIGAMSPGEAQKLEFKVNVPDWLLQGAWLTNRVTVFADGLSSVSSSESTLLSDCAWLKKTTQAKPFVMPTSRPSVSVPTENKAPTVSGKPALRPTPTSVEITVAPQSVEKSLDVLTVIISIALGALFLFTVVMIYRRIARK